MKLDIGKEQLQNYTKVSSLEWIETNGLGGYASSTLSGAHTRSYHGLYVAATLPPVGRMVLLSKLEEKILIDDKSYHLSCAKFKDHINEAPLAFLTSFKKEPFPEFIFDVAGINLKKTICFAHNTEQLAITYEVINAPNKFSMELKPLLAFRDFHSLCKVNSAMNTSALFGDGTLTVRPYGDIVLNIFVERASFRFSPEWFRDFDYSMEQSRGLDHFEDLYLPGSFILNLKKGDKISIVISTQEIVEKDAYKILHTEKARREALLTKLKVNDEFTRVLSLAADQFLVKRGDLKTIIAGYHWFSDWGRDTMIALPGLCLVTQRFDEAKKILQVFAASLDKGMIPNRFPDEGETPEYNTVDATLWYFVAIYKYWEYTQDKDFVVNEMLPVLEEIIDWHYKGTRYQIHVDRDGLVYAGQPGVQLTWMDAKVGDWVVTPRQGKAVEINALWYNALQIIGLFYKLKEDNVRSRAYQDKAMDVKNAFLGAFLDTETSSLYDCIDNNYRSNEIRPNQIFAISLPFELLDKQTSLSIIKIVEDKLLTPYGLRSLAQEDEKYVGTYGGNQYSRDGAYHQGTVWSWLLGPYITAKIKIEGTKGRQFVKEFLKVFERHFHEAGIGTVSEIFEGNAPYHANGCVAQAWGVAELLRAYVEDVCGEKK